ncbi:3-methyl-2-oxobutanoate hydroxymethyltransferase [Sulfitobacter sp. SK012]|uniref:3-methyl-2-oxobutanoate hydroxymethyltransferase n=1 Tax=Sulfitobacter sp. SK012 TaxID=1389005 RepID=UPI000E09E0EF|nr:3-methyl-2-oxobutanoate hydroxymethyltransferase [Sulfitobacter sp. SK012]AXI48081.1 3-methyl-2-oxobutanoate hydroxymethyltransferase [Sulfitobacter sp. SK012]
MKGLSVKELLEAKGKRKLAYVQVTREEEAIAAGEAGMDMIGTAFIPERAHFAKAVPGTHFQFGLPWGKHASATEALRDAMAAMQAGAQSVYCGMSPAVVEVLAREGVPVICHVGLVPPKATWTGGYRAVGKTLEQAKTVWRQVQAFEDAGAFAVELEVVAANLASEISPRTSMLTISLGSGGGCDAQYLFSADLLGENRGHIPRHAKTYRNFAEERDRLQSERIAAYQEYIADVTNGAFPDAEHIVEMDESALGKVWQD